jgi:TolB-like protein/DNA-binding winged helix-turn-helix (wHTH) protein/Tfp pilus assembly protein PilF
MTVQFQTVAINGVTADFGSETLRDQSGAPVDLRPQAFAVLRYFVEQAGRLVTKDELMQAVWPGIAVTDDSLVQCVHEIRRALHDDSHAVLKTVPRRGYRLDLPSTGAVGASPAEAAGKTSRRAFAVFAIAAFAAMVLAGAGALYWLGIWRQHEVPPLPEKPSVAVLPFANLSNDPEQSYFADGVAEELITGLSRLSDLFVVSRNSAFAYRGQAVDVRQVGRELGVQHVLEGSVRRADDQVRINVQLVDAATGRQQWAERYDGSFADTFGLQDQVANAVIAALALELTPHERVAIGQHQTSVPEAYEAFLRGWELYQRTTPQDFIKAIPHFERAIELDPGYGRAHAALAMVYFRSYEGSWAGSLGMSDDTAFRQARDHLRLAGARPSSLMHQVAGSISRGRSWYDDAVKEFNAAIALDPSDSWNYAELAYALICAGRAAEAAVQIEKAIRLDPHYPPVFAFYRGLTLFARDQMPDAARAFEEAIQRNPDLLQARLFLAATYGRSGRTKDAAAAVAGFNATRVRQGGVPFVMDELSVKNRLLDSPEKSRLIQGLAKANIPHNFDAHAFDQHRLTAREIDALLFGHRIHGRTQSGDEHGMQISADGETAMLFGGRYNAAGTTRLDDRHLCIIVSSTESCFAVFRNPGGTRARENEYFMFDGWVYPFSQVD